MDYLMLASARGPLASMHALDVMWVSFYSIGAMLISVLIVTAARKWVNNGVLSFIIRLFAFGLFSVGTILMLLVVLTWPN
ncbi:DUF2768 domain-containing protein [Lysinibacillus endophyticus]|uniref:DUF2768 domain-containing protein n=1 Tax=Ureibacillus endophyticus TaxID=1978490 RepID=A0A494Z0X2_9BACL|nr:DUF2768 domain-containing protein [Lysinibacillus endophyticus]RKQ16177.1 DUF2768 domain-containing protein [Lysinibacillus endophyticus]